MNNKIISYSRIVLLAGFMATAFTAVHASNPRATVGLNKLISGKHLNLYGPAKVLSRTEDVEEPTTPQYYPVFLEITDPADVETVLDTLQAVVYHHRGSIYLTSIPVDRLDRLPRDAGVNTFQLATSLTSNLDIARQRTRVDEAQASLSTISNVNVPSEHKVVTGICDVGFDPRHAAFRNSLKRWVIYDEYSGTRQVWDGYDNIVANAPETDNVEESHATHVANILAGYYAGSPYYGVAPATDFVATTSRLSEVGICSGIEDVIELAKETGRPAVVNISAGSYLGPHDGTDLVGRYLSALAEDAVICFSSGNYGQRANCQSLDLDDYDSHIGSAWCDTGWSGLEVLGGTDMWSRDATPFEFRLVIWDVEVREFKYIGEWMGGNNSDDEMYLDLESMPWFTGGGVWAAWGIDDSNGRYNVALEYNYTSEDMQTAGPWARYAVGYHIRKVAPATHVDVYSDGIMSFLHGFGVPGCVRGIPDGSASNMSSCPDVVSVGAWHSRTLVPDVEQGVRDRGIETDIVGPWSAFGTTGDGRKLPHFCAPGNTVVSAMSTPHSLFDGDKDDTAFTAYDADGFKYYGTGGTSMSSPIAAGTFALWLGVYPQLGVHDLRDIAVETANRDFPDIDDPRWGAGALDAMAGLEKVRKSLEDDSVADISNGEEFQPVVYLNDGSFVVIWPGVEAPQLAVYDLAGRRLANAGITKGCLYLVTVTDPAKSATHTFKVR